MDDAEIQRFFDVFNENVQDLINGTREEDTDKILRVVAEFSRFFGRIVRRVSMYEALIKRLGDYTDSDVAKELIDKVLEPDTSAEVEEFSKIINENL